MAVQRGPLKGAAGAVIAAIIVIGVLVWLPVARLFLALAVVAGIIIAGGLYLWHKYKPAKTDDYNQKRPLGLS
jgi:hypothetical protein